MLKTFAIAAACATALAVMSPGAAEAAVPRLGQTEAAEVAPQAAILLARDTKPAPKPKPKPKPNRPRPTGSSSMA
ncbi:MAG: hypothetical protein ACRCTI_05645 [Beijerinckiaceae bacterium]